MSDKQKTLSSTAHSLITLLNNISDLISVSNKRKEASDVMRALTVYAQQKKFPLPDEKIDYFHSILLDSRPFTINYLVQKIAAEIVKTDLLKQS